MRVHGRYCQYAYISWLLLILLQIQVNCRCAGVRSVRMSVRGSNTGTRSFDGFLAVVSRQERSDTDQSLSLEVRSPAATNQGMTEWASRQWQGKKTSLRHGHIDLLDGPSWECLEGWVDKSIKALLQPGQKWDRNLPWIYQSIMKCH